jgi:pyruvate formate lyase activating enzyme
MEKRRPLIFDIKRHALEDGPGIRTTVFFKGCQLRCIWCQNPESIDPAPEIGFYPNNCIQCGECITVCKVSAISMDDPGRIDRERCDKCGDCVKVCPGRGLLQIGHFYPIAELVPILLRDRVFYEVSGGGVTLSGGEPALYVDYVSLLLQALKKEGIHTAIETNGLFHWGEFNEKLSPWLDLIMFDVKLADLKQHLAYTGRGNEIILENLTKLVSERPRDVIPRTVLIPHITAINENLRAISQIYQDLGIERCTLLPYNPLGFSKAENIGKKVNPRLSMHMMEATEERECREIFSWAEVV